MKTIVRRSLITLPFLVYNLFAEPQIINHKIIKVGAEEKIAQMSKELFDKTGVSTVVHLMESVNGDIITYKQNIEKNISSPYILLVFAAKEQKVDVEVSKELKDIVDKNRILNTFIIPILAANDKNSVDTKYSAAILNGVAEMVDEVAQNKGVTLESSIGSESRYFIQGLRFVFYGIIVLALIIYFYYTFRKKRTQ